MPLITRFTTPGQRPAFGEPDRYSWGVLRVAILDLGDTLVGDSQPFPHVPDALRALAKFNLPRPSTPSRLTLLLVSDFTMVDPPVTKAKTAALVKEYLALLDGFGLRSFFTPVSKRITLSTQVGVNKPNRRIYEAALERSGTGATLHQCLAITENAAHLAACRKLGMATLRFGGDFTDWSAAPDLVKDLVAASASADAVEEGVFRRSLEAHGQIGAADEPLASGVTHVVGEGGTELERKRYSAI